jgi:HD-GYP domain-containing protein (c-di-GMP phosphodiesterase class II)/signal transduction histidine kinase
VREQVEKTGFRLRGRILVENLQTLEKKLLILQEISSVITATKDITTLAYLMLDRAIEYTNAEKGSLMLKNELDELYILAARGFDIPFIENYKVKVGDDVAGFVAKNRSYVLVEDIETDPRFERIRRNRYKTKSFISCSIISGERLYGVININDKKDATPFTEDELNLLNVIADQAAIAFENAFLIRQLRAKASDLEDINRKLIETDIDKTEFITRISHELRSPLNSIKGAVYYLLQAEKLKRDKATDFYNIILNETTGLVSIVENLIDFLRLENEALVMEKSLINLPDLLNELSRSKVLRIMLTQKDIQFDMEIQRPLHDIIGDRSKVTQMFMNLMEGLSFHLRGGDRMNIAVKEDDYVHMTVTVSRNIAEEVISNLSKSKYFFYKEWSFDEIRLYLAKKAAEAHGWIFETKNSDDNCIVNISIPKSEQDALDTAVTLTMNMFADFISELLGLNICSIMLRDNMTADLVIKGSKGLSDEIVRRTRINVGEQIAGWVAASGKPLLIGDIEKDLHLDRKNIAQYNTKSLLSLPLKTRDRVIGVLNLNNKKTAEVFTKRDLYIALIMSDRIAHFIEGLRENKYEEAEIHQTISSLAALLDAVKKYHKKEKILSDLVLQIMDRMGTDAEEKKKAIYVSMIYDLGLMNLDESILLKGTLGDTEMQSIRNHPHLTVELLNSVEFAEDVKKAILHHHERYDGAGYPSGLKGDDIPLISRVIAVVDSYRAMISERSYNKQYTHDEALLNIKSDSGTRYDPEVVSALDAIFQENL